jgi:5,10-methylenetetrahydromethanopterin reductase
VPGGADWLAGIEEERSDGERHLAVHEGHLVAVTDRDRPLVAAAGERLPASPFTGSAAEVAAQLELVRAAGVTEVAYNPIGSDIARELEAFAAAARHPAA